VWLLGWVEAGEAVFFEVTWGQAFCDERPAEGFDHAFGAGYVHQALLPLGGVGFDVPRGDALADEVVQVEFAVFPCPPIELGLEWHVLVGIAVEQTGADGLVVVQSLGEYGPKGGNANAAGD
jgi:hypothetical protein